MPRAPDVTGQLDRPTPMSPQPADVAEAVRMAFEARFLELCDIYTRLDSQCGGGDSTGILPGLVRAVEECEHFDVAPILKDLGVS